MNPYLDCLHCQTRTIAKLTEHGTYVRRCMRCGRKATLPDLTITNPDIDTEDILAMVEQGHTHREIANHFGMSVEKVYKRVYWARRKEKVA